VALDEMLQTHPDDLVVHDLAAAIEALSDCAAHCNACADACLGKEHDMTRCVRSCLDCADVCQATAAVLARAGASATPWRELAALCADLCDACADECESHDTDHCRACTVACRRCAEACRTLVGSA
jgi:hypothetical protein